MKYEYYPAGTCIFEEGDLSNDKFYVILKGSVSIVKRIDKNVFVKENKRLETEDLGEDPGNIVNTDPNAKNNT